MKTSDSFYNSFVYNLYGLKFFIYTLPVIWLIFFQVFSAHAQQPDKDIPIHISSDKMLAGLNSSVVIFVGNVEAVRGNSTLAADSMKVYFSHDKKQDNKSDKEANKKSDNKKDLQNSVYSIIANGNVRYTSEDKRAFSDRASYIVKDGILVLEGKDTRLETGKSFVTGKKITIFRQQEKIIVESAPHKRVQATLSPQDKPKSDKPDKIKTDN